MPRLGLGLGLDLGLGGVTELCFPVVVRPGVG